MSERSNSMDIASILAETDGAKADRKAPWAPFTSDRPVLAAGAKGLLNPAGENNCFLNSVVQVLWHLDSFRKNFLSITGHACTEKSCIFCALKVMFTQFQFSDHSTIPPDSLRRALAMTFAKRHRFQLGLMDDASECYENILRWIHFHLVYDNPDNTCHAKHCIPHSKFSMFIQEQVVCYCGMGNQELSFNEFVHYINTSSLVSSMQRYNAEGVNLNFASLLKSAINEMEIRKCSNNCGNMQTILNLTNAPEVLSIGLVWDSDQACPQHIADVMSAVDTSLKPSDLFHSAFESSEFQLVGVLCYYHKHYSTFLYNAEKRMWSLFDDAWVKTLGPCWSAVVAKICSAHYQPLLLLYAKPHCVPVVLTTAAMKTFFVDGLPDFMNNKQEKESSPTCSRKSKVTEYEGGSGTTRQSFPSCCSRCSSDCTTKERDFNSLPRSLAVQNRANQTGRRQWRDERKQRTMFGRHPSFLEAVDGFKENPVYVKEAEKSYLPSFVKKNCLPTLPEFKSGVVGKLVDHRLQHSSSSSKDCLDELAIKGGNIIERRASIAIMPDYRNTCKSPLFDSDFKADWLNEDDDLNEAPYISPQSVKMILNYQGMERSGSARKPLFHTLSVDSAFSYSRHSQQISNVEKITNIQRDNNLNLIGDHSQNRAQPRNLTGILSPNKRLKERKKSVSFSDSVALITCSEDSPDPIGNKSIDSVVYPAISNNCDPGVNSFPSSGTVSSVAESLTELQNSKTLDDIGDLNLDDDVELLDRDSPPVNGEQIRCNLCQKKWIDKTDMYCFDCSAYMSKLQAA